MWANPQFTADLVTFTEKIRNGKLPFLCSAYLSKMSVSELAFIVFYTNEVFACNVRSFLLVMNASH